MVKVTFKLVPAVGVQIFKEGRLVETCSLADKAARLAAHGYTTASTPRYGFSASGAVITKRGK